MCVIDTSSISDEIPENCNVRIYAGVLRFNAAYSQLYYKTDQTSSRNHSTTRFALANVLISTSYNTADRILCDSTVTEIRGIALSSGNGSHSHRLKLSWKY
jgi:hypothetical protein